MCSSTQFIAHSTPKMEEEGECDRGKEDEKETGREGDENHLCVALSNDSSITLVMCK